MAFENMMVSATTVDGRQVEVFRNHLEMAVHCYAVIVHGGKILISPQWRDDGFIFPGGLVELGENHIDGLVREVKEETGLDCKPGRVIDVFTSVFMNFKTGKPQHSTLIFYAAEVLRGHMSSEGFDRFEKEYARPARWVTLDELKRMKFTCNTQEPAAVMIRYLESVV